MHKHNNFDFLRFLFALFVVISHAYPLSGNTETSQWIYQATNGQIVLAKIGLNGFFIISGYFIFKSLQRSKTLLSYFIKRFLRLFPALFVVLVVTLMVLPFVYQGSVPIFKNKEVFSYLPNNLSLYNFQPVIRGVFNHNPYHSINGSLWTIRYEFSMYVALSILFFLRHKANIARVLLGFSFVFFLVVYNVFLSRFLGSSIFGMLGYEILDLGSFFICGSLLASFNFEKRNSVALIIITFIILLLALYFNIFNAIKHVFLPVLVLAIGFTPIPIFSTFGKLGDMSYGIYIYSFPVQQFLVYFFGLDVYSLMIYSSIISIILGYVSWHLIEKHALKLKQKLV